MRRICTLFGLLLLAVMWTGPAGAANGDNLRTIIAQRDVGACASYNAAGNHSGVGTGIGFDGSQLYLSCWYDQHIVGVSPSDGSKLSDHVVIGQSGYGAMAWDNGRQVLWACSSDYFTLGQINLVTNVWTPAFVTQGCIDGLAYDASDDTIWSSYDASSNVEHYTSAGVLLSSNSISGLIGGCGNSGIAVGGQKLYLANNGCSQIYEVAKDFSSSTLFASFGARLEDLECDNITFAPGSAAIWSQDAYDNVLNAWEIPTGACLFGGGGGPGPPATLTLDPATATNPAGTQHCVTATVNDSAGAPVPGVTVQFSVSGSNTASGTGSSPTDANGQATFCYTGTAVGNDAISAYADTSGNGVQDPGEPSGVAAKTWTPGAPASLTLTPSTATNTVDSQHCVTATVTDAFGNPTPGITVRFSVTGSVTTSGSQTTDANGQATFCYTGPALPGSDVITAYADTNNNGVQDPGEPSGAATKAWVLPQSTAGCKVTDGGRITAANGDKATFGSIATVSASGTPSGAQEYQDHGAATDINVHSTAVLAVVCRGKRASVFGKATINGSGSYNYRIDMIDVAEPGVGNDRYRIRLSTGYDSGSQLLIGGNIQIH
jgi:Big-like domain-containing protein